VLKQITIQNFKSVGALTIDLGRVNVFIGENGAGKSNILEAIALAGAAHAGKLDNEFLASRGIRVATPRLMRSGFNVSNTFRPITVSVVDKDDVKFEYELKHNNRPYSNWRAIPKVYQVGDNRGKAPGKLQEELVKIFRQYGPETMRKSPESC
jgi:predicted ATPase